MVLGNWTGELNALFDRQPWLVGFGGRWMGVIVLEVGKSCPTCC